MRFEHELTNTSPELVFSIIQSWLESENAKMKESHLPDYILASHGRRLQPMGWRKDARKTMEFRLSPKGTNVLVTVEITPAALNQSDVASRATEAWANWNELLSSLWSRFIGTSPTVAAPGYGVDWNKSLRAGKRSALLGILILAAGLLLTFIFAASVSMAVVGVLLIVNGTMNYRSAKRRLLSVAK